MNFRIYYKKNMRKEVLRYYIIGEGNNNSLIILLPL